MHRPSDNGAGYELKVLAFADFHGNNSAVKGASDLVSIEHPDLVVVAGDLANHDLKKAELILRELSRSGSKVLFVPGNMDAPALAERQDTHNVTCLHGKAVVHGEVCFIGLGGATESQFGAPLEFSEREAAKILSRAAEACSSHSLIVVSHCPPKDTRLDLAGGRSHVGSQFVREFIEEKKPILAICGHIHEAQGTDSIGHCLIVNVGATAHGHYASICLTRPLRIELRRL